MNQVFGPLSVVGSFLLGFALLWSVRLVYSGRREAGDDALRLVLTIGGWTLLHLSAIAVVAQMFFFLPMLRGPGLGIFVYVMAVLVTSGLMLTIFAMAVGRYRVLEWKSIMWSLSAAADRGIPLDQAARALAIERMDEIGLRTAVLADLLEGGTPLPEALDRAHTTLPLDGILAARYGTETGSVGPAVSGIARRDADLDQLVRSVFEKSFYLGLVIICMIMVLTFTMLRIVPVFAKMFYEFEITLPPQTLAVVQASEYGAAYGVISWPLFLALLVFLLLGALHYVGWLPRDFPIVNWLTLRYDGALVMRTLALAARQQRPFAGVIWTLSRVYPKRSVRARLMAAGERINRGEDWCSSLRKCGLLAATDVAVLKAAERTGNVAWALDEMSDSTVRRWMYRLRLWIGILFPSVILLLGMLVAFVVIGLFSPLVSLIQGMS